MIIENGKPELTLDEIMALAILKSVRCEPNQPCEGCPLSLGSYKQVTNHCIVATSKRIFDRESKKFNGK